MKFIFQAKSVTRTLAIMAVDAILVLTLCAVTFNANATPDLKLLKEKHDRLASDIPRLNDNLKCKKDTDCDSLEYGAKPCGGPREYLIFSKKSPKASALKRKVAEFSALEKQINTIEQSMGDCMVTMPPLVHCKKKKCTQTGTP
jgi:hypothetical protein